MAVQLDAANDWLTGVRRVASDNCDERPAAAAIDAIVIHGISLPPGEFGGAWIDALFTNTLDGAAHPYFHEICHLRVSAHVLISRAGEVTQFVPFSRRAWHAGASALAGRSGCNDFSIGIELEGCDDRPYNDVQYARLAELIAALMKSYPAITSDRIVGHCDIAPGRKTDPGPSFDWPRLRRLLARRTIARRTDP